MATRFAVASGNWSNTAIWDNGALPVAGDFVYANGNTVTIDQNVNVGFISNGASGVYVPDISTPAMTSNNAPSGIASASSETSSSFSAWLAFDQNPAATSGWQGSVANAGWLRYDFPSSKIIRRYAVRGTGNANTNPRIWTFEGSNDGTTWTVLHTVSLGSAIAVNTWYDSGSYGNTTAYTKYRINITAVGLAGTAPGITELCMTESTSTSTGVTPNGTFTMPTAYNITCTAPNGIINQGTTNVAPTLTISATTGSIILTTNIRGTGTVNTSNAVTISGNGHNITVNGDIYGGAATSTLGVNRNASGTFTVNGVIYGGTITASATGLVNTALGTGTINVIGGLSTVSGSVGPSLNNAAICTINITGNIGNGPAYTNTNTSTFINTAASTITILGNISISTTGFTSVNGLSNSGNATINVTGNITGGASSPGSCTGITISLGSLTVTGTVIGGNATNNHGINQTGGTVVINGNVTGGTNCPGLLSNGTSATITGDIFASATFPGVQSTSTTANTLVNGSLYGNSYITPVSVIRLGITPNTTMVYRLATNTGAAYNFYPVGSTVLGTPATTDVRNGVTYASGALTGTLQVPAAANVLQGVPVDATVGTLLMTPQQFWDLLTSSATTAGSLGKLLVDNLNATVSSRATQTSVNAIPADVVTELGTSTDPIAVRLQNSSTVQTTGAQIAAYNV